MRDTPTVILGVVAFAFACAGFGCAVVAAGLDARLVPNLRAAWTREALAYGLCAASAGGGALVAWMAARERTRRGVRQEQK